MIGSLALGIRLGGTLSALPAPARPNNEAVIATSIATDPPRTSAAEDGPFRTRLRIVDGLKQMDAAELEAAMKDKSTPLSMLEPVLLHWSKLAPADVLQFLSKQTGSMQTHEHLRVWARSNLNGALDAALEYSQHDYVGIGGMKREAMHAIMSETLAQGLVPDWEKMRLENFVPATWDGADFPQLAQSIRDLPLSDYRTRVIEALTEQWATSDPDAVLAWANTLDVQAQEVPIAAVISQTTKADPVRAAEMFATITAQSRFRNLSEEIATSYAKLYPAEAYDWVNATLVGDLRTTALYKVFEQFAETNVHAAAEFALNLPEGDLRENGFMNIASTWVSRDPSAAMNWAGNIRTSDADRAAARKSVGLAWAQWNEVSAAEFIMQNPHDLPDGMLATVAKFYSDKADATAWATGLPESLQREALSLILPPVKLKDTAAVLDVVLTLRGQLRAEAFQHLGTGSWRNEEQTAQVREMLSETKGVHAEDIAHFEAGVPK